MPPLEHLVARRVRLLRESRGWSQAELARRGREAGMKWTPGVIGLVETGGQRVDRIIDVVALCRVFDVSLEELLGGDDDVDLPGGQTIRLSQVREALAGQLAENLSERPDIVIRNASDDPDELARIGRKIGLTVQELEAASRYVLGTGRFLLERDERAGVDATTPRRTAQARRGHATRLMLAEIAQRLEQEGRETVISAGSSTYARLKDTRRQDWMKHLSAPSESPPSEDAADDEVSS